MPAHLALVLLGPVGHIFFPVLVGVDIRERQQTTTAVALGVEQWHGGVVFGHGIHGERFLPLGKQRIGDHGGTHGVAVLIGVHTAEFFPVHLAGRDQLRQLLGEVVH